MARVLVVEDEPDLRALLRLALEDNDHVVDEAGDGAEALQVMRRRRPGVVLLDLMMPSFDGVCFLRAAAAMPEACPPVVVVSAAHDLQAVARELLPLGVRAWIRKPFDLEALLYIVEQVCA